jgi:hypothetical protein
MCGCVDHAIQILLDIENCDRWNRAEIERSPIHAAIGSPENSDVGRSQYRRPSGVVAID